MKRGTCGNGGSSRAGGGGPPGGGVGSNVTERMHIEHAPSSRTRSSGLAMPDEADRESQDQAVLLGD